MALGSRSALIALLTLDVALIVAGGVSEYLGHPSFLVETRFGLDSEAAIPAWYASAKLLVVGAALWVLSVALGSARRPRRVVRLAALLFLAMSCDEAAGLHEAVDLMLREHVLSAQAIDAAREWQLALGGLIVGVGGLLIAGAVVHAAVRALRECRAGAGALGLGFLVFVAGAVVVDLGYALLPFVDSVAGTALALEEGLELVGASLMIYGALAALATLSSWEIDRRGLRFRAVAPVAAADVPPRLVA